MSIVAYDNSRKYEIANSGTLFWSIFYYATNLLYIYPNFFHWFQDKVISDLSCGQRTVFATYNDKNKLTGYMVIKNTKQEQKICTLQILPEYRKQNFGSQLITLALSILNKPIITVSSYQLDLYQNLLSRYNFSLIETLSGYTDNSQEFVFQHLSE